MAQYQIYRVTKGKLIPSRVVEAESAWDVQLNKGECVFGKR